MTTKYKPQIGDIVHVIFWDHCENFYDAMQFEAFGKITSITKTAYLIHSWRYHDPLQRATDKDPDSNENWFAIVKKAVVEIRKLT